MRVICSFARCARQARCLKHWEVQILRTLDLGSCEGFRAEQLHFVWSVVVRVLPSSLVTSLIALRHFQINDVIDDSDEFVHVQVSECL